MTHITHTHTHRLPHAKAACAALILAAFTSSAASARGKRELILPGHWVYDALTAVCMEQGILNFALRAPVSVGDVRTYLNEIDYDALSGAGRDAYRRIADYCTDENLTLGPDVINVGVELETAVEGYFKTDADIPWNYSRYEREPLLLVPAKLQSDEWFTLLCEVKLGEKRRVMDSADNYTNLPLGGNFSNIIGDINDKLDWNWPENAYGSAGVNLTENTSINFKIARGAQSFSRSLIGSVTQSEYFTNSTYAELGLYTPHIRYSMNINQFNVDRYFYSHEIAFRFFKKVSFTVRESTLIRGPLELRFLNPLMIFHGFSPGQDYSKKDGGEQNSVCAYLAMSLSYVPVRYLRLYAEFSQTEFQGPAESKSIPNGLSFQGGAESFIPLPRGYLHLWLEGVYTMPYVYLKEDPRSWLFHYYREQGGTPVIYEWLGSPFGPDTAAGKLSVSYEDRANWSVGLSYLLKASGKQSGDKLFDKLGNSLYDGVKDYKYDWWSQSTTDTSTVDIGWPKTEAEAQKVAPSGTPEFTNTIALHGDYTLPVNARFLQQVKVYLEPSVTWICNYENKQSAFRAGFEIAGGVSVKVF